MQNHSALVGGQFHLVILGIYLYLPENYVL
jgi:hypothetical protein